MNIPCFISTRTLQAVETAMAGMLTTLMVDMYNLGIDGNIILILWNEFGMKLKHFSTA